MDEKQKVLDILNKFSFILGQRAGRELWFDKPEKVQNEDLSNFNEDIKYIKTYIESSNQPIWYKIKDDILPPINTHVRCVLNWCDILYYATGWYNDKGCWDYTDNVNGDAELIAWAYLPEYKK